MADRPGPVQYIPIDFNTAGTHVVMPNADVAGRVVILNFILMVAGAVVVTWEDANGVDRIGPLSFAANGGMVAGDSNVGWARTAAGQGLNLRLSANVRVAGSLVCRIMPP